MKAQSSSTCRPLSAAACLPALPAGSRSSQHRHLGDRDSSPGDDAPAVNPYVPVGQFWHVDSAFAAPVPLPNLPATQLVQTVIPTLADYEPTLHGWHLLVVMASAVPKYPGLQKYVQVGLDPETSALESAGGGQVVVRHVAEAPVPDTA